MNIIIIVITIVYIINIIIIIIIIIIITIITNIDNCLFLFLGAIECVITAIQKFPADATMQVNVVKIKFWANFFLLLFFSLSLSPSISLSLLFFISLFPSSLLLSLSLPLSLPISLSLFFPRYVFLFLCLSLFFSLSPLSVFFPEIAYNDCIKRFYFLPLIFLPFFPLYLNLFFSVQRAGAMAVASLGRLEANRTRLGGSGTHVHLLCFLISNFALVRLFLGGEIFLFRILFRLCF